MNEPHPSDSTVPPLPVHDMESDWRPINWVDLTGKLIGSVVVTCALALIVAGTVRLFVELWP